MPLVVDFPCEPATATQIRAFASSPSNSARLTTGMPAFVAASISRFPGRTAAVITTSCADPARSTSVCPMLTGMPSS